MKKPLFFIFIFLSLSEVQAFTRTEALQISKNRIETLSQYFSTLAYNCFLFEKDCQTDDPSQEVTLKLIGNELSTSDAIIQYSSGADNFTIDGAVRIAKTGNNWNTPVIFNEDLLTAEKSRDSFIPLGFFEILGILVHEYGHHQEKLLAQYGLRPLRHEELDEISVKVVSYLQDRTRRIQLTEQEVPGILTDFTVDIYQIDIEWNNGIRNLWSQIFIDSPAETLEISSSILKGLYCPRQYQSGHLTFVGKPAYASFRQVRAPRIAISETNVRLQQEVGDASVLCIDSKMGVFNVFDGYKKGTLTLDLTISPDKTLIWNKENSRFTATPPPETGN